MDPVAAAATAGMFCGLRLLPGPDLEAALPAFHEQLARHVLDHLPFEFQKMANLLDPEMKVRTTCVHLPWTARNNKKFGGRTTWIAPGLYRRSVLHLCRSGWWLASPALTRVPRRRWARS